MKKLLLLILSLVFAFALFACGETEEPETVVYNTNVPTAGLTDTVYASYDGNSLTEKQLYNLLRANSFSTFVVELTRKILGSKGYTPADEDIIDSINNACYSTSDADEIAKLSAEDKATYEAKFIDNLKLAGIDTTDMYAQAVKDYFKVDVLEKMYAKEQLAKYMAQGEKVEEDGEEVDNEYYFDEDDYKATYETYFDEENTFEAIIIPFYTLNDLEAAVVKAGGSIDDGAIVSDDIKALFLAIYNDIYAGAPKAEMTAADLAEYDSTLVTYVNSLKANEYTARPAQFGEYKFLVYKISESSEYDYDTLDQAKKDEYKEKFIESLLTSTFISNELAELLCGEDVVINDPYFDALFAVSYDGHERLLASEWTSAKEGVVAEYGDVKLTVSELYNVLEKASGMSIATSYFVNKALLKELTNGTVKLTDDEIEAEYTEYEETIESFNAGNMSSYPAEIGEEYFRTVYYGFATEDEVKEALKANLVWQKVFAEYDQNYFNALVQFGKQYASLYYSLKIKNVLIYVDTNMDGSLDDPDEYKETLDDSQKAAFDAALVDIAKKFVDEVHYVNAHGVSELEDAVDYVVKQYVKGAELGSIAGHNWNEYKKFNIGIKSESTTTYSIATTGVYQSFLDGVEALYKKLNAEGKAGSDYVPTSDEITSVDSFSKTVYGYHLLTSFGTTTMDSAASSSTSYKKISVFYNPDLSTVSAKYDDDGNSLFTDTSATKHIVITDKDGNEQEYIYKYEEYTEKTGEIEEVKTKTTDVDGVEVTNGWYITKSSSSSTNYYYLYDANGVKIEVGTKIGEDGNAATLDATNENNYASENQYRIYIAKSSKLPTTPKNFIAYFYSAFTTRYTDTQFQNVLLINKYLKGNVVWNSVDGDQELDKFIAIQQRSFDEYEDYSTTANNKFAGWWNYLTK